MSQQSRSGSSVRRAATSAMRRSTPPEGRTLRLLVLLSLVLAFARLLQPDDAPLTVIVLPMVLASIGLGPRHLPWFIVFLLLLVVGLLAHQSIITGRNIGDVGVLFAVGFIILLASFRRTRLGVAGAMGESMLVDLRDRIQSQSSIPDLPNGFRVESALRSAGGTPFAGDFVVSVRPPDTDRFDVAVVDVSGKGENAGTRALLLAGALGGLMGALPPEQFLPSANEFLLRQDWDEGFATAVHLSLDLRTGGYEIRNAGHPSAAHRGAGSGRWEMQSEQGPALGLLDGAEFPPVAGQLRSGDAVVMYTDGMVETRDKDIDLGIDKLLGRTDALLRGDFEGGAEQLIDSLGSRNDDRALVLVYRG